MGFNQSERLGSYLVKEQLTQNEYKKFWRAKAKNSRFVGLPKAREFCYEVFNSFNIGWGYINSFHKV